MTLESSFKLGFSLYVYFIIDLEHQHTVGLENACNIMDASLNSLWVPFYKDVYTNIHPYAHRYETLPILQVMHYKLSQVHDFHRAIYIKTLIRTHTVVNLLSFRESFHKLQQ